MIKFYFVQQKDTGSRLDLTFLTIRPDITRSVTKKLIIKGIVDVNHKRVLPNYKLKFKDKIYYDEEKIVRFLKSPSGNTILKPQKMDLDVLYEDEYTLVINKDSGLNSHPAVKKDNESLLNGINYYLKVDSKFDHNVKPRLVHRLDRETSGVILVAKDLKANDFYSKLFETRNVKKVYVAIVHGDFLRTQEDPSEKVEIESIISSFKNEDGAYHNTSGRRGKHAKTVFYFDKYFNKFGKGKFSRVFAEPQTGRTHQIRVHLASLRHPILGDKLYGGQKYRRLMLHAYSLTIPLYSPDGKGPKKTFTAPLPEKFED